MTIATRQASLFPLGQLFMSRGVIEAGIPVLPLVVRHSSGDWGDLSDDDRDLNERALAKGGEAHLLRLRPLRGRPLGHDSAAAQRAMTFHDDPSSTLASRPPIP